MKKILTNIMMWGALLIYIGLILQFILAFIDVVLGIPIFPVEILY